MADGSIAVQRALPPKAAIQFGAEMEPEDTSAPARPVDTKKVVAATEAALNSRFSDMFKAFQYLDVDGSGSLSAAEFKRALVRWNLPHSKAELDALVSACDKDGDGEISLQEFRLLINGKRDKKGNLISVKETET